ncbi:MAG: type IV pilin protein, partial [Casimicrobiaceae bacterium]
MLVLVILAILAGIAYPSYSTHIQRGRILEAVTRLSEARARMEQYFLDQRAYVDASGSCGVPPPAAAGGDAFALVCTATASTYTYTATGIHGGSMAAFAYSIDQTGLRTTVAVPAAWTLRDQCWTIRQDGLC